MKKLTLTLILTLLLFPVLSINAQTKSPTFKKVKIVRQDGDKIYQQKVIVTFLDEELNINSKSGTISKTIKYSDIESAEYSYSKNPRWKTGLGMGAAGILFPPLLIVAIPLGFSKHRRHWLTIKTEKDYAVLKLSKSNRKIFMPTFETKTGVTIKPVGEDK